MKLLKFIGLTTAALCAAVFLFALATMPPSARKLVAAVERAPRPLVSGVYHVHTRRSDGTGTVDDVAAAAARAGVRFVIFTDHGDGTRTPDPPSYRSGVLCIDAVEVSTWGGHYAAIGMRPSAYPLGGEPRDVVDDVTRLGGFGVAAHPDSPKAALRWRDWAAPFDAIEWLNSDSQWRDKPALMLAHTFLEFLLRGPESLASLFARPDVTFTRFDALTRQRRVVLLAGADAHARMGFRGGSDPYQPGAALNMPSYESVFRTFALRAQLDRPLTGRAAHDALAVRSALAAGHVYTAIDALATPAAFEFVARSGPFFAHAGDDLTLGGPVDVEASVNTPDGHVVLLENGRRVAEGTGALRYQAAAHPAVFRVEVDLPGAPGRPPIPWIVSNPIYAGGLVDPRGPAVRGPASDPMPLGDAPSGWAIENEPHSKATIGGSGPGEIAVEYALAPPPAGSPFIALMHPAANVETHDRLQFRARADRPMRISVQLRVPTQSGGERWQRSVYVDQAWRDVTVFLDDMRPIGPTSTYQPTLATADSVLFVVDTTNARPGAQGSFALQNVQWAGTGAQSAISSVR